jgi:hypothetical protein
MRRILLSVIVLIGVIATAVAPACGEPAPSFVLRAFAAEERAPKKRAHLNIRRGHTDIRYDIERVLPDKLHMRLRDGDQERELYVIGDRMYNKGPQGWTVTPAAPQLIPAVSVVGLFENGLENVKERARITTDGVEQRVFEGTISWFSGRSRNAGEIRILIETTSVLPRLMTFKGTCGSSECSFEHAITYDPAIAIEAPVP